MRTTKKPSLIRLKIQNSGFSNYLFCESRYKLLLEHMNSNVMLKDTVKKNSQPIHVLSIGCGLLALDIAALKNLFPNKEFHFTAIDINEKVIHSNKDIYRLPSVNSFFNGSSVQFIHMTISRYNPEHQFDVILWTGMETKLDDTLDTIQKMTMKYLKPGGILFTEIVQPDQSFNPLPLVSCTKPHFAMPQPKPSHTERLIQKAKQPIKASPSFFRTYGPHLLFAANTLVTIYLAYSLDDEAREQIKTTLGL